MWLPLALADLMRVLVVATRRAGGDTGKIEMIERSDILASWALPVMAEAVKEDEDERRAFALLESVRGLKKQ